MKVYELIEFLKKQPQHLDVAYCCYSEAKILIENEIKVEELCVDRADGWVPNRRPDRATKQYLLFPGN